jgi:hypothetical protein
MTSQELSQAFAAVDLALQHAEFQNAAPGRLQRAAEGYGCMITTPANIKAVLSCIDISRLIALIDVGAEKTMTINATATDATTHIRSVCDVPIDLAMPARPRSIATILINQQPGESKKEIANVSRVWIEADGKEYEVDASAVRDAAVERLKEDAEAEAQDKAQDDYRPDSSPDDAKHQLSNHRIAYFTRLIAGGLDDAPPPSPPPTQPPGGQ